MSEEEKPPWGFIYRQTSPFSPPGGRGGRTGDGREEQKLPISNSLPPPAAPTPTPTKSRGQRSDPREKHFYGILILWLFLQFLNFKWESWNTDVDMKRFIVAVCHYSHRPCCYYRWGSSSSRWEQTGVFFKVKHVILGALSSTSVMGSSFECVCEAHCSTRGSSLALTRITSTFSRGPTSAPQAVS